MSYVLNKTLNTDLCDEINKLLVNDKINDLRKKNVKLTKRNAKISKENKDLKKKNEDLKEKNEDLKKLVDISSDECEIIENMISSTHSKNTFQDFIESIDERHISFNICDNFSGWYEYALPKFLDYIVEDEDYNFNLVDFITARNYAVNFDGDCGNMAYHLLKPAKQRIMYYLLLKRFEEEEESHDVCNVIDKMKEFYENKIEEEDKIEYL